jgi:hypothetical protein
MAQAVRIAKETVVRVEGQTSRWTLSCVETIHGIDFVRLTKRDGNFCSFLGAYEGRSRSKEWVTSSEFLDKLRQLRTEASMRECLGGTTVLFDDPAASGRAKRRARNADKEHREDEAPCFVVIHLPAFNTAEGHAVDAIDLKVKADVDLRSCVSVELSETALLYVREAMRAAHHEDEERKRAVASGEQVRWRWDRRAWMAWRGKRPDTQWRQFLVKDEDNEILKGEAKARALLWAAGEEPPMPIAEVPADGAVDGTNGSDAAHASFAATTAADAEPWQVPVPAATAAYMCTRSCRPPWTDASPAAAAAAPAGPGYWVSCSVVAIECMWQLRVGTKEKGHLATASIIGWIHHDDHHHRHHRILIIIVIIITIIITTIINIGILIVIVITIIITPWKQKCAIRSPSWDALC